MKKFKELATKKEAEKMFPEVVSMIDKLAKNNIIHNNNFKFNISNRAAKNVFLSGNLGTWEKIVCEMKVLFTIAYIQYTIGLQLYLLKRYIDKVTESGFQAIKVSGDVEK